MPRFLCKAIFDCPTTANVGPEWMTSKRCLLKVSDRDLMAGRVTVPFEMVRHAHIRIVPSASPVLLCILTIETHETTHHFGLTYSRFWRGDLPFEVTREKVARENPPPHPVAVARARKIVFVVTVINAIVVWWLFS
ncbi:MAG: hypothetical protein HOI66_18140 [Verrucomicrobia bacterium]|nr:hypothetical protein [Verrucomicrobiota bacterium]